MADFGVSEMIRLLGSEGASKPYSGRTARGPDSIGRARIGVRIAGLPQARRAAHDFPRCLMLSAFGGFSPGNPLVLPVRMPGVLP